MLWCWGTRGRFPSKILANWIEERLGGHCRAPERAPESLLGDESPVKPSLDEKKARPPTTRSQFSGFVHRRRLAGQLCRRLPASNVRPPASNVRPTATHSTTQRPPSSPRRRVTQRLVPLACRSDPCFKQHFHKSVARMGLFEFVNNDSRIELCNVATPRDRGIRSGYNVPQAPQDPLLPLQVFPECDKVCSMEFLEEVGLDEISITNRPESRWYHRVDNGCKEVQKGN